MPQQIELSGNRSIQNMYATDGRKLKTTVKEGEELMDGTKYYNANFVFDKQKEMEYILFDEGRIVNYGGNLEYEYHLKDHLGSVRVAFEPSTNGTAVVQENAYYPFGAPIAEFSYNATDNKNRYLREGKEYIDDFDWNKYDFLARTFDSWELHTPQIDPLCEKYYHISPYAMWMNNPIKFIDPNGKDPFGFIFSAIDTWFRLKAWCEEKKDAAVGLATGTSGQIDAPVEAGVPEQVQKINQLIGTAQDVGALAEGTLDVIETGIDVAGLIPGVETAADVAGALCYTIKGDYETAGYYTAGLCVVGVGGVVIKNSAKTVKSVYKTALSGGKHSGFLKNYSGKSTNEINKAITSYQKTMNTHLDKVANPSKYVPDWSTLRPEHQQSLMQRWQIEITNFGEQIEILQYLIR